MKKQVPGVRLQIQIYNNWNKLVSGYLSHNIGAADLRLDLSNGAVSNGKNLYFKLTGTLTANRTMTMPDSAERVLL